ncbi:MAG: hypothetical protein ACN6I4_01770 [bacterium]
MYILLVVIVQASATPLIAQHNKQMFMFQIDGNNYEKRSYDKKGKLKSSQAFKEGTVKKEQEQYSIPLKVYAYDKHAKLKGSAMTEYTCKPSNYQVLMYVFPYAEYSANKTVKIKLNGGNEFYPANWETGKDIQEISFELTFEGSVLGAFGTSSKIKIYDRNITTYDSLSNTYTITAKIQISACMFSVQMDTIEYTTKETVHPQKRNNNTIFPAIKQ